MEPLTTAPPDMVALERQAQEHLDGWKRAKADYLNLKKQTDREKQEIAQFAVSQTILLFLPIYDNLGRALKHVPADQLQTDWAKGLEHTRKQFEGALGTMGLALIPTVGQMFDPARHHAVSKVKKEGVAPGTIIEEVKSGFQASDRVLEPAQVVVAE
jgi:molecular chaperone GrpE